MTAAPVHASCLLVGQTGLLIRGPSGSGKSSLCLALLTRLHNAVLVADDRVVLEKAHGRVLASVPPSIAGLMEVRGLGIVRMNHEPRAVVRLVIDLADRQDVERFPDPDRRTVGVCGVEIDGIRLAADDPALVDKTVMAIGGEVWGTCNKAPRLEITS